jgi:uracil phosphoribosyltransferase
MGIVLMLQLQQYHLTDILETLGHYLASTITEDLTASKVIFKDKIREVRTPLLAEEDVVYMKALEAGDSSAQSASVTKKNALRDAPANSAIANASSISALKSAWDASCIR